MGHKERKIKLDFLCLEFPTLCFVCPFAETVKTGRNRQRTTRDRVLVIRETESRSAITSWLPNEREREREREREKISGDLSIY